MTDKNPIKTAREMLGMTQAELGAKLGVYWSTISRWENDPKSCKPRDIMAVQQLIAASKGKQAEIRSGQPK